MGQQICRYLLSDIFSRPPRHQVGNATRDDEERVVEEERRRAREDARRADSATALACADEDARIRQALRQLKDLKDREREEYPRPAFLEPYEKHVNIALTGESGVGKSSMMNALLETNTARVGLVECTMAPTRFDVQAGGLLEGKVHFWDLPGVGTMNFPADEYIRKMGMRYFDVVVLVVTNRIMQSNVEVARELMKHKVPLLVVINKMDDAVQRGLEDHQWSEDQVFEFLHNEHKKTFCNHGCNGLHLFCLSASCIKKLPIDNSMNRDWPKFRTTLMSFVYENRVYEPGSKVF